MSALQKIYQALIKVFVRQQKRYPAGAELTELEGKAKQVFDGALTYNVNKNKGLNLDDIEVMEKTSAKSGDELINDFLDNEAEKAAQVSTKQVDETTPPQADIEALPLKDDALREAAVQKKLQGQNEQAIQSKQGGESSGGQRGQPELVDKNFGDTIYVDKGLMQERMKEAYRSFDAAEDALSNGNLDDARGILRYEIEDNMKYPKNVREAAADARYMIKRGEGIDTTGFDSVDEAMEELSEKINQGRSETNTLPDFTDPYEGEPQLVEYVDTFAEAGEDFGTPNSKITDPDDVEFAEGGRVGYAYGSGLKLAKVLKDLGLKVKNEIKKAVDDIIPTGNPKMDADMAIDNMLEEHGIDRDDIDGYDILDAYGEAYDQITKPTIANPIIVDDKTAPGITKFMKKEDPEGFKEIEKIVDDINRGNELKKFDVKDRKPNAEGGLNYLLGF